MSNTVNLKWIDDLRFEGHVGGSVVQIDGTGQGGTSPVNLLLESVGACTAADVVDILRKGRQDLRSMSVEVTGDRRDEPPKYVKRLRMKFRMSGDVDPAKAQRAVDLSLEKYCSVFHTLRMDLLIDTEVEIEP